MAATIKKCFDLAFKMTVYNSFDVCPYLLINYKDMQSYLIILIFTFMKKHLILVALFFVGLIISAINPHDYFTWILEVFPGIIGFIVLVLTYKRFQFTYLTYIFILLHCYILFIGGHYTYAQDRKSV